MILVASRFYVAKPKLFERAVDDEHKNQDLRKKVGAKITALFHRACTSGASTGISPVCFLLSFRVAVLGMYHWTWQLVLMVHPKRDI